jgi:hypothetical protein
LRSLLAAANPWFQVRHATPTRHITTIRTRRERPQQLLNLFETDGIIEEY